MTLTDSGIRVRNASVRKRSKRQNHCYSRLGEIVRCLDLQRTLETVLGAVAVLLHRALGLLHQISIH